MKKTVVLLLCAFLLSSPYAVRAETVLRSGNVVSVEANQTIDGNFYGFGNTVTISGPAKQDIQVAGVSVTINAPVAGDVSIVGGSARILGDVADDVRVIGGEVQVASAIAGDLVVMGGAVEILSTGSVGGNILFFGNELTVSGPVTGFVLGTGERVRINAAVGGDVSVRAISQLTLGENAQVGGNISYTSASEIVRAQNATVDGTIKRDVIAPLTMKEHAQSLLLQLFIMLFATLSMYMIARRHMQRLVEGTLASHGMHGLIGLVFILATPLIALLLAMSLIGLVAGITLMFFYVATLLVGWIFTGVTVGSFLRRIIVKKSELTIFTVVIGTVVFVALPIIPYVGVFLALLAVVVTVGGLVARLYHTLRG